MKGQTPKPTELKKRQGNPGNQVLPEPVPIDGGRELQPPKDWDSDAKECWDSIVPTLQAVGILDSVDRMALEALCLQWARAKRAAKLIETQSMFSKGSTGQLVEHPAVATERAAHTLFLRFAEHYALTPVARARIGLAEREAKMMDQALNIGKPKLKRVESNGN